MPRALDLFSGTNSVGRILREHGWDVTSVDILPRFEPTFCVDVMEWDFKTEFRPGDFDYVHLSPPCTEYSVALRNRPRRLEEGDRLVRRALEILHYAAPCWWTIENPDALLKTRACMQPFAAFLNRVCYCKYSDGDPRWSYRKRTCIWTNLSWTPRPMCCKTCPCEWIRDGKHLRRLSSGSQSSRSAMPPSLVDEWARCLEAGRLEVV